MNFMSWSQSELGLCLPFPNFFRLKLRDQRTRELPILHCNTTNGLRISPELSHKCHCQSPLIVQQTSQEVKDLLVSQICFVGIEPNFAMNFNEKNTDFYSFLSSVGANFRSTPSIEPGLPFSLCLKKTPCLLLISLWLRHLDGRY